MDFVIAVTKTAEMQRAMQDSGNTLDEEILQKAFRVFEKQSEVDYFINKNARAFLHEQFDLWLYHYIFKGESNFTETRLKQLQALKEIVYKTVDFIAQFEDELVKIWNKPKFVLNSHYVITLDKIAMRDRNLLLKLFNDKGMKDQISEWCDLGILNDNSLKTPKLLLEVIDQKDLIGDLAYPKYQFLPLDTRHFISLELDILSLFDDLDNSLDGWLIHSENYQALVTLLPKFRERIDVIYIDPPYNTNASEIIYVNNYKNSSWLTLIENRLEIAKSALTKDGLLCITIDDFELYRLRGLLGQVFGDEAILGTVAIKNNPAGRSTAKGFSIAHEYALFVTKSPQTSIGRLERTPGQIARYDEIDGEGRYEWVNFRKHGGANAMRTARRRLFYPIYISEKHLRIPRMRWDEIHKEWITLEEPTSDESILYPINPEGEERTWKWQSKSVQEHMEDFTVRLDQDKKLAVYVKSRMNPLGTLPLTWWDKSIYSASDYGTNLLKAIFGESLLFSFPKSVYATSDCIKVANPDDDITVMDFFSGSGTTAHAVMNLNRADDGNRKYIMVEMDEHFNTVILPRIKKIAFSDKWKNGEADGGQGLSHFAKYFELEQYEDTLRRARYEDAPLFKGTQDVYSGYIFLRDLKLLDAVQVNTQENKVEVDVKKLFDGIDLAETFSCITGKWIKRITKEAVEFQDGTSIDLAKLDWNDVKPLIWW